MKRLILFFMVITVLSSCQEKAPEPKEPEVAEADPMMEKFQNNV